MTLVCEGIPRESRVCASKITELGCSIAITILSRSEGLHALAVQAIKDAEPLTDPVAYSGMTNLRRLYEDIPMPGGLAVVGDSLAGFNPVLLSASP